MMNELRTFPETHDVAGGRPFRAGVSAGAGKLPEWKRAADFLFAQVRFSLDELLEWRAAVEFDGPVYAGVMVVPSAAMARKITADIPQLAVPDSWMRAIERDPAAGVELACDLVAGVRDSGAFDGVHLIPVSRYREVAARLEAQFPRE
jgi:5,10-methylenetetrahydrofolate reductase